MDIYQAAVNKWDEVIISIPTNQPINISFGIADLATNVLGQAYISNTYTLSGTQGQNLTEVFPASGVITLNQSYFATMKADVRSDGNTRLYYVILHEIGHILGIGSFFGLNDAYMDYTDNGVTKKLYIGANALREYRNYF